jgi:hypothetical protein
MEYTVRVDVGADNVGQDSNVGHDVVLSKDHTAGMLKLFRDCLRLVQYIAPRGSNKHGALKQSIVSQFKSRAAERDSTLPSRCGASLVQLSIAHVHYQKIDSDRNSDHQNKAFGSKDSR